MVEIVRFEYQDETRIYTRLVYGKAPMIDGETGSPVDLSRGLGMVSSRPEAEALCQRIVAVAERYEIK